MSSSYRPRRTRIYGANYDMGERYYKKQLDELDHKRGLGRTSTPLYTATHLADDFKFKEPSFKTDLADERNSIFPKRALSYDPTSDIFDDEYGSSTLSKKISSVKFGLSDDVADLGSFKSRSARKHFDSLDLENDDSFGILKAKDTKKRLDAFDVDREASEGYVSRKLKIKTGILKEEHGAEAEEASMRMKATKSRLADLESEMMDLSLKHSEREKRNLNLKRLLNDCDSMKEIEY